MESYAAAFGVWKSAQSRLESAIQEYLDTSLMLKDVFSVPPISASSRNFREQKLFELELGLQSFSSYTKSLSDSRNYLCQVRNTSHRLSPICVLPSDLVHMILCHAVQLEGLRSFPYFTRRRKADLVTLSGVCSAWRRLMLRSPTFWTSPELVLAGSAITPHYELARLWAERSRDAPLNLLLYGFEDSALPEAPPDTDIVLVSDFLTTLLPRVHTLNLCAAFNLNELLYPLLYRWATHGTAGKARWLYTHDDSLGEDPNNTHPEISNRMLTSAYTDTRPHNFATFFRSLAGLSVGNPLNGSSLPIHAGLVELWVNQVDNWRPTIWDIRQVLMAAPRLCVLCLINMFGSDLSGEPDSVRLDNLKSIWLHGGSIWRVLGFVTTASRRIEVRLSVDNHQQFPSIVKRFFSRTNIAHLYLNACYPTPSPSLIVTHMPDLCHLTLDGYHLAELGPRTAQTSSDDLWPALRDVYLIRSKFGLQALEQLVSIHVPQTIHLDIYSSRSTSVGAIEELSSRYGVRTVRRPMVGLELGCVWW